MLLTPRFVFVHVPKTGGTFVARSLKRLLGPSRGPGLRRRLLHPFRTMVKLPQHAPCAAIPASHGDRPILSNVRNPWSHLVSMYHFGWWKDHRPGSLDVDAAKKRFPAYPDLEFPDYLAMIYDHAQPRAAPVMGNGRPLGFLSRRLVRFFARRPAAVMKAMDDRWIEEERFRDEFHVARFLRMESLNSDLHDALVDLGHDPAAVAFIREAPKILPTPPKGARRPDRPWREYWGPELVRKVRDREPLFWAMFPGWKDAMDRKPAGEGGNRKVKERSERRD